MNSTNTKTIALLTTGLAAGLLFMGALRFSVAHPTFLALVTNWTFAAFGEEFAYRILLMRAIAFVLGDTRFALVDLAGCTGARR